ncbi:MAG: hypothetical protein PHQ23_04280 [Candidatus Wallbacteria bacterium]|nr:hypothetical protein [Candidatus Wallbacteria bacterium]
MKLKAICFLLAVMLLVDPVREAWAKKINWGDIVQDTLKATAVAALVRQLAEPINDFVNSLLLTHGAENRDTTKVVPIFSVGYKTAVGAAQVSGPQELVNEVRAVFTLEGLTHGKYRVKAYIPNRHSNPFELDRVYGVGVTAIIDGFL